MTLRLATATPLAHGGPCVDVAQILDNLLENAIRYSPPAARSPSRPRAATLLVSDTGPGIPEEERARVFERFYRGAQGRRTGPGTGLGLAIVAELAARWGAEVELLDAPGTRIRVRFRGLDSSPAPNRF